MRDDMTLREKLLYQNVHPVKLAVDAVVLAIAAALLWQQHVIRAALLVFGAMTAACVLVLSFTSADTWTHLRSGRYRRTSTTAAVVLIRISAMLMVWTGAWYRSWTVCVTALAAGVLTWANIRISTRSTELRRVWVAARQHAAVVLAAAERHANALAAAVLAVALIDLCAMYIGAHPFRDYVIENADLLYLPALFSDILEKGGRLSDWYLTPAPYFFPDYVTYAVAYVIGSTTYVRLLIFAVAQTIVALGALWLLARGLSRNIAFAAAVTTAVILVWFAVNAGEPFVILLASASHFGSFISAILLAALWLHYQSATRGSRTWALLGAMCALAAIATLSDTVFIAGGALPLAIAVMSTGAVPTRVVPMTRAHRAMAGAAWVGLMLIVPLVVYRLPVPLPTVNVAWSPAVDDRQRSTLEARFHLLDGDFRGGHLWTYRLADWSPVNVAALVANGAVADTQHIDRRSFNVDGAAGPMARAAAVIPVGAAVATVVVVGSLFVVRLWGAMQQRAPVANDILALAPILFSAAGAAAYGVIVANPTRYPLSIGLEKTYGNFTDLAGSVGRTIVDRPVFGVACAAYVAIVASALSWPRTAAPPRQSPLRSMAVFSGASIAFTVIALSFVTDLPVMPRYLIPVFCWPLVVVSLFAQRCNGRTLAAAAAVCLVAMVSLTSEAYAQVRTQGVRPRYYSGELACIDNALEEYGVTDGVAQYWDAKYLQEFSRLDLTVAQYLETLERMPWITSKRYFKERYDFAVVDESAEPTYKISVDGLNRSSGPPLATFSCGTRTLYIYGKGKLRF